MPVYPVDFVAVFLHFAEPCALAFGELTDGVIKVLLHIRIGEFARDVLRQKFVFQPVIYELGGGDAGLQQRFHLVDHTLFEARFQTGADTVAEGFGVEGDADETRGGKLPVGGGMKALELQYLDSA